MSVIIFYVLLATESESDISFSPSHLDLAVPELQKCREQDLFIGENLHFDVCLGRYMLVLQKLKSTIVVIVNFILAYIPLHCFLVTFCLHRP